MKPILPLLVFLAGAMPAMAQAPDAATEANRDLWCGLAFEIVGRDAPTDATPEQRRIIDAYVKGGEELIARARAALKALGYTDAALDAESAELRPRIDAAISTSGGGEPAFSFEECSALIGLA